MSRMRQVRSVIWERRDEDEQSRLKIEEAKVQIIAGAVHAAAGNKKGVAAVSKIRFARPDKADLPSTEAARRLFPAEGELVPMKGLSDD